MRKTAFIILFAVLTAIAAHAHYYIIDTLQLNSAYRALMADPDDPAKQMAFFEAFPDSWTEYSTTYMRSPYGSDQSRHNPDINSFDRTMGDLNFPHIIAFTHNLPSEPDSLYCAKMANLCTVAVFDDDIASQLNTALISTMRHRKAAMLETVDGMTPNDQLRFWLFYWGTFVPVGDEYVKEFEQFYK